MATGTFSFALEDMVGFSNPGDHAKRQQKQLACARCHSQKLKCVRQQSDASACDRCLGANTECTARHPQRMGRPVDAALLNSSPSTFCTTKENATPQHKKRRATEQSLDQYIECLPEGTLSPLPTPMSDFNQWRWPTPDEVIDHSSNSSSVQPGTASLPYGGPVVSLAGFTSLMPNFDDLPMLTGHDAQGWEGSGAASDQPTSTTASNLIDQLSALQLHLSRCLNQMRSIERQKRPGRHPKSEDMPTDTTSWMQDAFQSSETFMRILKHPNLSNEFGNAASDSSVPGDSSRGGFDAADIATGLTIISCYTRLLQVFEVFIALLVIYRGSECAMKDFKICFGTFSPTHDKTLQIRLVAQYILHLCEGMAQVVKQCVPTQPVFAKALADGQSTEARLKGQLEEQLLMAPI
ncbi:hypothetical protein KVR01_013857 [Diaporthe batatas]|uniref:uncharacterized protein n=1 Tax=Diaporthe batatas TaxID=748121 RepID=UPI001D04351E|nr:uncharacterized protein KVR01_013857 [Diaporthe batatas]KAG8156278.1 hypothetical protein KVR01_013857 [Diaporthe batatas]